MRSARAQQKISPGCGCRAQERIANRTGFRKPCASGGRRQRHEHDELRHAAAGQAACVGKQQRKILGPSLAHLPQAAIHAGADHALAQAEAQHVAGALHTAGQGNVLEQISGDGGVSANRLVDAAPDQQVLAVGRRH